MNVRMFVASVTVAASFWILGTSVRAQQSTPDYDPVEWRLEQAEARVLQLQRLLEGQRSPPLHSVNYSFDDHLGDLQAQVDSLAEEIARVTRDKTIVHSGTSKSTMQVAGRIHVDGWGFSNTSGDIANFEGQDPQNRIGFRRVRFGVRGDVTDNMVYRIEMEFAGGNNVEFRDVFLGWTDLPFLQRLLLGNQKRPYGLDNMNSSRYNVFLERPWIIESFNQDARRFGLASYGVSEDLAFNWRYGVYNLRLIQDEGNHTNDHLQLEFAARLANTVWYDECSGGRGYAHWALSGSIADPDGQAGLDNEARFRTRPEARSVNRWIDTGLIVGADVYGLLGAETVINVGRFQFVGEYQNVWMGRDPGFGNDLHFHGGYFYVSYFLTGEHMPWDRTSGTLARIKPFQNFWLVRKCDGCVEGGWGAWQIAARYSYGDLRDDDVFGGIGETITAGLNWYWNENARMQFNFIHGEVRERFATLESGDFSIFGARFMIDF